MQKLSLFLFIASTVLFSVQCSESDASISGGDASYSQSGSTARFTVYKNNLYVVDNTSIIPIDITNPENPIRRSSVEIGNGIETIFPYKDNLFIGSNSAVFIYSIQSPNQPSYLSQYSHSTGCDPVIVEGRYAYVTLREGRSCGSFFDINVLEVVDISNLLFPTRVNSINMKSPEGLGIGGIGKNQLFVAEKSNGLVQFDLSSPSDPLFNKSYIDVFANDVIAKDTLLIVTENEEINQFKIEQDTLILLSSINFN